MHRDIKPANLLFNKQGKLFVTDFGLARVQSNEQLTFTGDMLGTLRYMSPEQVDSNQYVDARSDIYSLGLTLYELLAGQPANDGDSKAELIRKIREATRLNRVTVDIPTDLRTIVEKATAIEVTDRYQTARELGDDLQAFLDLRTIKAKPSTAWDRLVRFARRNPAVSTSLSTAFVSLLLLALVASMWGWSNSRRAKEAKLLARQQEIALLSLIHI